MEINKLPNASDGNFEFGWVVEKKVDVQSELVWVLEEGGKLDVESIKFDSGIEFSFEQVECVNSCNGLVCLEERYRTKHGYGGSFCSCNPMLRECVTIPLPQRDEFDSSKLTFGFSAKNNQYKVLHCFSFKNEDHAAEIYSLGTGEWRTIEVSPACMLTGRNQLGFNTFLESKLHWTNMISLVCCFDFEIEEFKSFRLPPEHTEEEEIGVKLGVFNGCLCSSFFQEGQWYYPAVEIWIMKDYGVENSWTPLFAARQVSCYHSMPHITGKCSCSSTVAEQECISSYNSKEKKGRLDVKVGRCQLHSIIDPIAYKPSFVSLKEVAKEEQVIVSR